MEQRILRLAAVRHATGLSKTAIYRAIKNGTFPAPVKLTPRSSGWRASDVEVWIESRPVADLASAT